jgi:hypothetical protein
MSGVNPFNFASWNLGGLNWNAWGEPNEVGLDDTPPVTTTPPPPQATDTVTIGSNFTFDPGTYQPPNGWSQSDIVDIGALVWDDEFIQDLNLQDPMFWLGSGDMFPEGRHRDLTEEQATAIDYQTYTTSLAKDLGVSWPKYQKEVESARQEFQNSNVQSHHQGGSYFFSLEPSARVTSQNANPIIERNENLQAANNLNQQLNDLKKSSKEDFLKLVQQLEANGYRVQGHKIGGANDRNPNDSVSEVYQRVYYTLNGRVLPGVGNVDGVYPFGGMDGFQNVGGPSGVNDNARSLERINLLEHEKNGSHTLSEHVGKSREFLMSRMQPIEGPQATAFKTRHSTFSSLEAANALVSSTLATGTELSPNVFYKQFGSPTGTAAVRRNMVPFVAPQGRVDIETTFGVTVFVVPDPTMPNGIRIHSAYPSPPFSK